MFAVHALAIVENASAIVVCAEVTELRDAVETAMYDAMETVASEVEIASEMP